MSEFEHECEEYGCSPILAQWGNVVDMLVAQSEPKNHKKEKKIWENKWSQMCIENGWDDPDKNLEPLAPKVRNMEKRAHMRFKKHVEGKGKTNWLTERNILHRRKNIEVKLDCGQESPSLQQH